MANWELELFPAAGGASTRQSITAWGAAGMQIQFVNWGIDQAALTMRGGTIATDAPQFAYKDKLVIWRNNVRFFHGWVTGLGLSGQAAGESRTYTLSGPSWWLANYAPSWPYSPWVDDLPPGEYRTGSWLAIAINSAAADAPISSTHSIGTGFTAPCPDLRASSTCLEMLQRAARLHPMSAGWWDYSGELPAFCAATRSALTAETLAVGPGLESLGFTPRPDLQLVSVLANYTVNGSTYLSSSAGTPLGVGPNHLIVSVPCETTAQAEDAASFGMPAALHEALGELVYEGVVNLHELPSAALPVRGVGRRLSLTGGRSEWETMAATIQSVSWSVPAASNDLCSIQLGAPEHLGPQDFLEFARAGYNSGAAGGGNPSPYTPPTPPPTPPGLGDTPGTYQDLNDNTPSGEPGGSIAVESRGGAWSLVGLPPWTGDVEGQPPVRYRSVTPSGTLTGWGAASCGQAQKTHTLAGSCQWSPTTGALTAALRHVYVDLLDGANSFDVLISCESYSPIWGTGTDITITPTEHRVTGLNDCIQPYGIPGKWTGYNSVVRGDPDSDEAAIARLWIVSAEWGAAQTAVRTVRTSGTTGLYREMRYRTEHTVGTGEEAVTYPTLTGLTAWQRYRLTVTLEGRPVDSAGAPTGDGSYSAAGTRTHYILADLDGEAGLDWQVIEPTAGYETRIASTLVEVAP